MKGLLAEEPSFWKSAVISLPELLDHSAAWTIDVMDRLESLGVSHRLAAALMTSSSAMTSLSPEIIEEQFSEFIGFCVTMDLDLAKLCHQLPDIGFADSNVWTEGIARLKQYFTKTQIKSLVELCPDVLVSRSEREIEEKMTFLLKVMRVAPR